MVNDHLQVHQAHFQWMVAASEPRPKDCVPLAEHPRDDCSEEEHSDEEEIPHPSVEQVAAQLQSLMVPLNATASTSASNSSAPHPSPRASLETLTLKFIECAKKEELLASSNEEELLTTHGLTGKISMVCSHVSLASASIPKKQSPPHWQIHSIMSYFAGAIGFLQDIRSIGSHQEGEADPG